MEVTKYQREREIRYESELAKMSWEIELDTNIRQLNIRIEFLQLRNRQYKMRLFSCGNVKVIMWLIQFRRHNKQTIKDLIKARDVFVAHKHIAV